MREPRSEVRNAADPKQVKQANQREQSREERRQFFYIQTLETYYGRAVIWDLLGRLGLHRSLLHNQGSMLYYNVGRHDFALELLAEVVGLSEKLYTQMEAEARERNRADANETAAAHTRGAEEMETGTDGN